MDYKEICKHLKKHGLYHEVCQPNQNEVQIHIIWGDWKHDHALTDYLMREIGWIRTKQIVTEENGDDSYSSIHYYTKIN